ncbi:hypothetical protein SAMN05444166_6306 [Singulisphaera sp. GP187]|uniref:hypothetical protein n=1 Tax=Singulisphaera sp. GP187 TaxID=1882752 RepID=UPI000928F054|nr:hypothetical protein [Singulisphaera sp. GP187]SIO60204.1 hypothetical protein SAMN05444166_6306 [Singulisphaera sp. GP187]
MRTLERPPIAPNSSGARNVPYLNLEDAIEKARILFQKAKRSAIHLSTAANYLGYSPKASSVSLVVSALKKYGLAVDEGSAEGRRVKLTELGFQIVADSREHSPDRDEKIRHAALLPKAHRELWEHYGPHFPDDNTIEVYLKLERSYTADAARHAVRVYRATILYAGLNEAGILGDVAADEADTDSAVPERPTDARSPMDRQMDRQNPSTEWTAPTNASPVRTLSFPLKGSRSFDLRFPANLTKEDFEIIGDFLKVWERQFVATE